MKKVILILIAGLLLSGCTRVYESKVEGKFEIITEFQGQLYDHKPKADEKCQLIGRGNSINFKEIRKGKLADYTVYEFDCEISIETVKKQKKIEKTLSEAKEKEEIKKEKEIKITNMIEDSKKACSLAGVEEGTDKFIDCTIKLYSQKVELAAKQNQQVVIQGQSSGSNVMTIYDPVRDNNALIKRGQGLINGTCTLANLSNC